MSNNTINATNSNIILNTEGTANISTRSIKKRRRTEEEEVVEEAVVEPRTDVDDSDGVVVLGHSKSLMHTARKFGLECCKKNFKSTNIHERYYAALSLNSIVDIYDKDYMERLNISREAADELKTRFEVRRLTVPEPKDNLVELYNSLNKMGCNERYKVLMIKSFDLSGDDKRKTVIMANIYKILSSEDDFLSKWKDSSEWSIIIKIWAPLFEALFENTGVELVWGDTKNETFKVDLRLCEHMFDISNIEFKKSGDNPGAVKRDRAKVLGEAKAMLNRKIRDCRLDFDQAKSKKVIVGQVCGLKAVFSSLHLAAPGCYIPYQYGRTVKYPNDVNRAIRFAGLWLEQLFCYKNEVVEEARLIKGVLAKDRSEFGSNTTIEDNCFLKQTYKIQDTAKKWPEINDDFYKW